MKNLLAVLLGLAVSVPAAAASFVYVSNAEDGTIGLYTLRTDGSLQPGERFKAAPMVMPMTVSPDKRFLVAAVRSKPFSAYTYSIDRATGALKQVGSGPLAESFPYITFDRSGRYLLSASYGAHLVSVNPVSAEGVAGTPSQVIPTARNAHAIITDRSNRFVFVPHLGTDQIFQFQFDEKSGRLSANTPPVLQLKQGSGPRHLITSPDNRFVFLLNELTATVTTLALENGILKELDSVSALPRESKLGPGMPRPQQGRDVSNDIWASDLHVTPNGRLLYAAERTSSTINGFSVDPSSGKLSYVGATPTEKQPRGFRIDPTGRFMVVSGEKSDTISSYAIETSGALRPIGKFSTGKGSNWVEIVSFD
jgi:6-phosphogluconolactonase